MKRCRLCGSIKPLTDFHVHKKGADGRHPHCKVCRSDPATVRRDNLSKYGVSPYEWDFAFSVQGERCALCESTDPRSKIGWFLDHHHATKQVRGILCYRCNTLIGWIEDGFSIPALQLGDHIGEYLSDPPWPRCMSELYGLDDEELVDQLP